MYGEQTETLRGRIGTALYSSLCRTCGGGAHTGVHRVTGFDAHDSSDSEGSQWTKTLKDLAFSSISFPNKSITSIDGKPHDIEVRSALSLFHRYKSRHADGGAILHVVSDMGLVRSIQTPLELARIICVALEDDFRRDGLSYDVRANASGIICVVTADRAKFLRSNDRLPCPRCVKWLKGEKGLWWHQQREHGSEHSMARANSQQSSLEIVVYNKGFQMQKLQAFKRNESRRPSQLSLCWNEQVIEFVKQGNLDGLTRAVMNGFDPKQELDKHGASVVSWAAGSGQLDILKYLIEKCGCSADVAQRGKRSFSGRTPLHWAARNGHLGVVAYLVEVRDVDLDATTADGTTAFCWACWQCHRDVMEYLYRAGCNVNISNSFGCNAVLWCAQGGANVEALKWLASVNCVLTTVNTNGHGAIHKGAQRGHAETCRWLISCLEDDVNTTEEKSNIIQLIGPDSDGCCPSDLAGTEGYYELASWLAQKEVCLVKRWCCNSALPKFLVSASGTGASHYDIAQTEPYRWEPGGGVMRMISSIHKQK